MYDMYNSKPANYSNVVGNVSFEDEAHGYKQEMKSVLENYVANGMNIGDGSFSAVFASPELRSSFIEAVTEGFSGQMMSDPNLTSAPFYRNYVDRVDQLLQNNLRGIANESVQTGYAPIVAYNPFFLKKQWIDCVFKDVLMTEVPKTPIIEIGFQRHYLRDMEGNEYSLPEALYNDDLVKKLMDASTGLNIDETPKDIALFKQLNLLDPAYIPGVVAGDVTAELTQDLMIISAVVSHTPSGGTATEYTVPMKVTVDLSTHNFVNGVVEFKVPGTDPEVIIKDQLVGTVDFVQGLVSITSVMGNVTKVGLRGKTANRYNQRSLDVRRRVQKIEEAMPESGPRLNAAVTLEDAADALALQNVDILADNVNIMGSTLANFEDAGIKSFLIESFNRQKAGNRAGIRYNDYDDTDMYVEAGFNAIPAQGYGYTVKQWMTDSREYFERMIGHMKLKLRSANIVIVAVANPNIIRFLNDGINWVFSDDTQISGVKLNYNFGIYTSAQDRVHVITTQRLSEDEGIRLVAIPLVQDMITYKHFKYNVCIDRNYRNPVYTLTPNILCTQRTKTFEVTPVSGHMNITGRDLFSPNSFLGVVKTEAVTP